MPGPCGRRRGACACTRRREGMLESRGLSVEPGRSIVEAASKASIDAGRTRTKSRDSLWQDLLSLEVDVRCAVDLVMYFCRHPNVYVTMGGLAARIGYPPEDVEAGIDALVRMGFVVR